MSLKKFLSFTYIKVNRYILKRKFISIFNGPLKGFMWSTSANYDYFTGEYEDPQVLDSFLSWLKPHSVLYDLGANVGYYALLAEPRMTNGTIYCFEPMPDNIALFQQHMSLNKAKIHSDIIQLLPFAISDEEKEVVFSNDVSTTVGNTYVKDADTFKNSDSTIVVKSYSIDGLVAQGYKVPDVIKIDVEGAELDVLKGAVNTLKSRKPNILLATHDCHLRGVKDQCLQFLTSLGYTMQHTGYNNKLPDHDDYIAIHKDANSNRS